MKKKTKKCRLISNEWWPKVRKDYPSIALGSKHPKGNYYLGRYVSTIQEDVHSTLYGICQVYRKLTLHLVIDRDILFPLV